MCDLQNLINFQFLNEKAPRQLLTTVTVDFWNPHSRQCLGKFIKMKENQPGNWPATDSNNDDDEIEPETIKQYKKYD